MRRGPPSLKDHQEVEPPQVNAPDLPADNPDTGQGQLEVDFNEVKSNNFFTFGCVIIFYALSNIDVILSNYH